MADGRATTTDEETRSSAFAPLAIPLYRALFLAQLGSNVGGWMQSVAAQEFLVERGAGPVVVAAVQSAGLLPVLLLSLLAGVLADTLDRRKLLLVATGVSTVAAALMSLLAGVDALAPWGLLLLTALLGAATAMSGPAWQSIQPELVPRDEIPAAASLGSVTVNAARAIGPALGGVLVGLAGPALVFAVNAASFIGVVVVLARWKRPPQRGSVVREPVTDALLDGLRYVRSGPVVRRILLRCVLFTAPSSALFALLPVVVRSSLGLDAGGYGLVLGCIGAGAVLGVAVMPRLRRRATPTAVLGGSAAVMAAGLVAPVIAPLPIVLLVLLTTGMAWIATLTTLNATLQLTVAPWVRARAVAVYLIVFSGGQGVFSLLWGFAAQAVTAEVCFLVAAAMLLLVAATTVLLPLRSKPPTADSTITALATGEPTLVFEPDPHDGPVVVSIAHRVQDGRDDELVTAMRPLEQSRRRTGASRWRLARSGEDAREYQEEFVFRSWGEYEDSRASRWTGFRSREPRRRARPDRGRGGGDAPVPRVPPRRTTHGSGTWQCS